MDIICAGDTAIIMVDYKIHYRSNHCIYCLNPLPVIQVMGLDYLLVETLVALLEQANSLLEKKLHNKFHYPHTELSNYRHFDDNNHTEHGLDEGSVQKNIKHARPYLVSVFTMYLEHKIVVLP